MNLNTYHLMCLKRMDALLETMDEIANQLMLLRCGDGAVLSTPEAAKYVDLSKATFAEASKQIPRVRLSAKRYGYIRADLDKWLMDNKEYPGDENPGDTDEIAERAAAAARGE